MTLTAREHQKLGVIDHDLTVDEPLLHRALAGMSLRPLRIGRVTRGLCAPLRHPGVRFGMVMVVLGAGVAALVVGELAGVVALIVVGAVISGVGPLGACRWLGRHGRDPGTGPTGCARTTVEQIEESSR